MNDENINTIEVVEIQQITLNNHCNTQSTEDAFKNINKENKKEHNDERDNEKVAAITVLDDILIKDSDEIINLLKDNIDEILRLSLEEFTLEIRKYWNKDKFTKIRQHYSNYLKNKLDTNSKLELRRRNSESLIAKDIFHLLQLYMEIESGNISSINDIAKNMLENIYNYNKNNNNANNNNNNNITLTPINSNFSILDSNTNSKTLKRKSNRSIGNVLKKMLVEKKEHDEFEYDDNCSEEENFMDYLINIEAKLKDNQKTIDAQDVTLNKLLDIVSNLNSDMKTHLEERVNDRQIINDLRSDNGKLHGFVQEYEKKLNIQEMKIKNLEENLSKTSKVDVNSNEQTNASDLVERISSIEKNVLLNNKEIIRLNEDMRKISVIKRKEDEKMDEEVMSDWEDLYNVNDNDNVAVNKNKKGDNDSGKNNKKQDNQNKEFEKPENEKRSFAAITASSSGNGNKHAYQQDNKNSNTGNTSANQKIDLRSAQQHGDYQQRGKPSQIRNKNNNYSNYNHNNNYEYNSSNFDNTTYQAARQRQHNNYNNYNNNGNWGRNGNHQRRYENRNYRHSNYDNTHKRNRNNNYVKDKEVIVGSSWDDDICVTQTNEQDRIGVYMGNVRKDIEIGRIDEIIRKLEVDHEDLIELKCRHDYYKSFYFSVPNYKKHIIFNSSNWPSQIVIRKFVQNSRI